MIYIKKQLGFYFSEVQLGDTYNVGTTLEDYDNGTFLLLNDDQIAFHEANPDATPLEVWNMEIPSSPEPEPAPEPDTLTIARQQKLQEIADQDKFSEKFFVMITQGGIEIANVELWANSALRTSLLGSTLPAEASDGKKTTTLWSTTTPSQPLEVPIDWAKKNLLTLEIYAKRTYDLMQTNRNATLAATTVEEIQAIDAKADYPHFLTFELNLDLGV
ncbi:hypothetical protein [Parabacteroides hominis]|uniref:DUF4376 domain-containing protein n=1 Tax=Parabacteroides hominis TaxID=2763057 RepID=A0ABR7DUN0_9BACT|nr:hypothetical protein [Parabacteroides hominis]MBC5635149.1 hypothetical protein [Parabacteroides hominis]